MRLVVVSFLTVKKSSVFKSSVERMILYVVVGLDEVSSITSIFQ